MMDGTVRSTGISMDNSAARSNGHNGKITTVTNKSMVNIPVSRSVKTLVVLLYHYSLLLEKRLRLEEWIEMF